MLNVYKTQSVNFEQIQKKEIAFSTKLKKTEHINKLADIIKKHYE
jgi:hypothetical protein